MSMFFSRDDDEEYLYEHNNQNYNNLYNEKCNLERELYDMKNLVNKLKEEVNEYRCISCESSLGCKHCTRLYKF